VFLTEYLLQVAACPPRALLLGQQAQGCPLSTESDPAAGLGTPHHGDVAEIDEAGADSPLLDVLERSWPRRPQAHPDQHPRRLTLGTQHGAIEIEPA